MIDRKDAAVDWSFGGSWPFEPRWFETPAGRLHYVDEGPRDRPATVLVHGNPTWGYLYRRVIGELVEAGQRVVVPDHLGFGRSESPTETDLYAVTAHADRLERLLDDLDLDRVTLAVHDWGGPIALRWAARRHQRVERLLLFNTFAPKLPGPIGGRASIRALRTPLLGRYLVRRRNVPVEQFLFDAGLVDPGKLSETDKRAYRAPHRDPDSRTGMLAFPAAIPFRRGDPVAEMSVSTAEDLERHFRDKPVRVCWGMRDLLFGPEVLERWQALLPSAEVVRLPDAGHFVHEDAPEETRAALVGFVA